MSRWQAVWMCLWLAPGVLCGQAVSEWRTTTDLPVAIIELAGGDVEHIAVFVPAEVPVPLRLAGFSVASTARRGGQTWTVSVAAAMTPTALAELASALEQGGAAAVVAVGPTPARELDVAAAALEGVPWRSPGRVPCVIADGGLELLRGAPERVDLRLALPTVDDPRLALVPALELWLEHQLADRFPGLRVSTDVGGGCASLLLRAPSLAAGPLVTLGRLREALSRLSMTTAGAEDLTVLTTAWQARLALLATEGAGVAAQLVERLALGGAVAPVVAAPLLDPPALATLTRAVLAGHAGFATVVEQEQRARPEAPITLENGTLITTTWVPGQLAVVSIALGNLDPALAQALAERTGTAAARAAWRVAFRPILGVPTLTVAAPASQATEVLETTLVGLDAPPTPSVDPLLTDVLPVLGMAPLLTGDTVSVALALPPEAEDSVEATRKFLVDLPPGGVRIDNALLSPGLTARESVDLPRMMAVIDLPPSTVGAVLAQLLIDRAALDGTVQAHLAAPPGRLLLLLTASGEAHVPALETRMTAMWKKLSSRPPSAEEVSVAAHHLHASIYGDLALATARSAARPFLAVLPGQTELLTVSTGDVAKAAAALPAMAKLPRFARGPLPHVVVPAPAPGGVRQSAPPTPRPRQGTGEGA